MPLRFASLLFALVLSSLAGCGTSLSFMPTNPSPVPMTARAAIEVEVFTARPDRPFKEVGIIEAQQQSAYSLDNSSMVLEKLRAAAGQAGCEGIIVLGDNDSVVGGGVDGNSSMSTLEGYRATCIMFSGVEGPVEAPAAPTAMCVPNETRLCYGPGRCEGVQACTGDGDGFTPCDCGPAVVPAASEPAQAPAQPTPVEPLAPSAPSAGEA